MLAVAVEVDLTLVLVIRGTSISSTLRGAENNTGAGEARERGLCCPEAVEAELQHHLWVVRVEKRHARTPGSQHCPRSYLLP